MDSETIFAGLPEPSIILDSMMDEKGGNLESWLSLEKGVHQFLCYLSIFFLCVLTTNLLTRLLVRYTELRGVVRVTSRKQEQWKIFGKEVSVPRKFPGVIISDIIISVQYFTLKLVHWAQSLLQMLLLNEMKGFKKVLASEQSPEVKDFIKGGTVIATRNIYLIRHGESIWNLIFNQSSVFTMPFRLLLSCICESILFCESDSLFLDSPLSSHGLRQCLELSSWVDGYGEGDHSLGTQEERKIFASIMRGCRPALFITSNLRRAISTLLLGWGSDMRKEDSKNFQEGNVLVTSTLQEATRNVDSYSLASPYGTQDACVMERAFLQQPMTRLYSRALMATYNKGNKSTNSTLACRQRDMLDLVFALENQSSLKPSMPTADRFKTTEESLPLVICGHSLYFRNLFRRYLREDHISKERKILNTGIVKIQINLIKGTDHNHYYDIVPDSIKPLFRGFA